MRHHCSRTDRSLWLGVWGDQSLSERTGLAGGSEPRNRRTYVGGSEVQRQAAGALMPSLFGHNAGMIIRAFLLPADPMALAGESTCYGTAGNGRLLNGVKLPTAGLNFST